VKRKILYRKNEKVRGEWRKLHNDELHDVYLTKYRLIKWKMRWAGHVACWKRYCMHILGFGDGMTRLKWSLKK